MPIVRRSFLTGLIAASAIGVSTRDKLLASAADMQEWFPGVKHDNGLWGFPTAKTIPAGRCFELLTHFDYLSNVHMVSLRIWTDEEQAKYDARLAESKRHAYSNAETTFSPQP